MCMYNLALNDELVRRTRQSFANEADMKAWLQRQVEALMIEYNTSQQTVRRSARLLLPCVVKASSMAMQRCRFKTLIPKSNKRDSKERQQPNENFLCCF